MNLPESVEQILAAFDQFIRAETWTESQQILEANPELLSEEADGVIQLLIAGVRQQGDEEAERVFSEHYELIARCREVGVEEGFAAKRGSSSGGMPSELAAMIRELSQLTSIREMPRRAQLCQQVLSLIQREQNPPLWAALQGELGNSLAQNPLGDRAENIELAIGAYSQALEVRTRTAMPVEWATTMMNLATAYSDRIRGERVQNIEQAIAAYKQALEVITRTAMPVKWATTMMNLATAYRSRIRGERAQNIESAIGAYSQALEVRTRTAMPVEWARTMMNLANAYYSRIRGERAQNIEEAIGAYSQALEVITRTAMPVEWATTMMNLATAYSTRIRGERAENIEEAIAAYKQALDVFLPEALPVDCRMTARLLGNLYGEENRWSEATQPYQLALEAVEVLYEASLSLAGKKEELAQTGDLFHRTAYALTRIGNLESAAVTLERGRARSLSETLARDRADLERVEILAPEVYETYQQAASLLRDLEAQERIRSTIEAKNEVSVTPEGIRQQGLEAQQKLDGAIEQIRQLPGYENFLALPTFEDISQALKPDEPLIYLTTTEYGSLALIVHRSSTTEASVESLRLDSLTDAELRKLLVVAEGASEFGGWFGAYFNRQDNPQAWFDTIDRVTNELWSKLMEPVVSHLKQRGVQQAILIPTGLLGLLPLDAAWTEDLDKPCGRRYALDEISFTYAPNARSLITAREIAKRTSPDALLAIDEPRPIKANELPNSKREVQTVIETFPNHRIFKQEQAAQQAVKNALSDYSVFHFSCHGYANFRKPLNSGLLMANDEILSLRDLFELRLDGVRLAVLSASETALPGTELIDEVVSLPTGMLQAGVAGVAASLWSVSDISTMMLMARFYDLWRNEGLKPPEALRQAQQWVRDTTNGEKVAYFKNFLPGFSSEKMATSTADALYKWVILQRRDAYDFAHPYHWAAFTYTGV
ncbi:MAG: CHAT domain-containing protein [Xenococcaceae cyanobacterium]